MTTVQNLVVLDLQPALNPVLAAGNNVLYVTTRTTRVDTDSGINIPTGVAIGDELTVVNAGKELFGDKYATFTLYAASGEKFMFSSTIFVQSCQILRFIKVKSNQWFLVSTATWTPAP